MHHADLRALRRARGARAKYKTTNWAAYNAALKSRGSLTIWLDRDMKWFAAPSGKRGRQRVFSDAAIQFTCWKSMNALTPLFILPMA
jgi:hypothetical protein